MCHFSSAALYLISQKFHYKCTLCSRKGGWGRDCHASSLWWMYWGHRLTARTDAQWRFNSVLVNLTMHYQPRSHLQCVTVKREPGPRGHPTGIKKALSVGCISQWAAGPRGAALLITAGVVCQRRHMMHGAIAFEGKDKTRSKIAAENRRLTTEVRRLYYSKDHCGFLMSVTWKRRLKV